MKVHAAVLIDRSIQVGTVSVVDKSSIFAVKTISEACMFCVIGI